MVRPPKHLMARTSVFATHLVSESARDIVTLDRPSLMSLSFACTGTPGVAAEAGVMAA